MTGRAAIAGVERNWASRGSLEPCPHCGEHHPGDWTAVTPPKPYCRRPPTRRRKSSAQAESPARQREEVDDRLRELVLDAVRRGNGNGSPLRSTNSVARGIPRRRGAVLAALHELRATGAITKTSAGWEAA